MSIRGLRVHIVGSAAITADGQLLQRAHEMVRKTASQLIDAGGGLVVGVGGEPLGEMSLPCIFDWTVLEAVAEAADPAPFWPGERRARFSVVTSQRALSKIPEWRQGIWDKCLARSDFEIMTTPPGWQMGGAIRARQALAGDVLVAVGGGAGTEQLAELYVDEGKRVIPLQADLGAISADGNGGSSYLHSLALSDVKSFFNVRVGTGGTKARLLKLRLEKSSNPEALAKELVSVIEDLNPPLAFYVRLVAKDNDLFEPVERFFRQIVDPVVGESFTRHEVGLDRPLAAFMNVEIFQVAHRSGLVVVDLTAVRPNCLMELGYALGRRRRVIVSAMRGTALPFDPDKLPTFLWEEEGEVEATVQAYRRWLERHVDMPPLVT